MAEQRSLPVLTHKGGSGATPLNPICTYPNILGKFVSLSLLDNDRNIGLGVVQWVEAISLVAHMEGSRPNRPELRRMFYGSFPKESSTVVDIQLMGKGCYHLELIDPLSVERLLNIKHTSLLGSWISFTGGLIMWLRMRFGHTKKPI